MIYNVIHPFHDLQDYIMTKDTPVYHEYAVGDTFPRKGLKVPEERIAELASSENKIGRPLIEPVGPGPEEGLASDYDIEKMSKKELLQFAKDWGVKVSDKLTKEEIRAALVEGLR